MILALYKAVEYWKVSAGLKGFKLINVLIVDQLLYFLLCGLFCSLYYSSNLKISFFQSNLDHSV
jgi:hypothetical protein